MARGRPRKTYDPRASAMVQALAQYGVPYQRIRAVLASAGFEPIGETKFVELYKEELEKGRSLGDSKLMETAFKLAVEDRNVTMLCFLLKTRLGLRETGPIEKEDGQQPTAIKVQVVDGRKRKDDE